MMPAKNKATLSPARRRLLELFQRVNFGRVENLAVKGGEPAFSPPPRVAREVKFGGENGPRRELNLDDFRLKSQVVELFSFFDELQNGTVEVLDIKHGLPFRIVVTQPLGQSG